MDKHKTVRNHIAAAKGWLSQAEESLEQENDIRGDLNLMLAQAELRSAQEKQPQKAWLLWSRRLLPLAAGFAAGNWWKLALVGSVVCTTVTWLYTSMVGRIASGSKAKAAPVLSALGLYLAVQCFMGILL